MAAREWWRRAGQRALGIFLLPIVLIVGTVPDLVRQITEGQWLWPAICGAYLIVAVPVALYVLRPVFAHYRKRRVRLRAAAAAVEPTGAERIEQLVRAVPTLSDFDKANVLELSQHGEWAIAFENLCTQVHECDIPLTASTLRLFESAVRPLGVDQKYAEWLRENPRRAG